MKLLAEDKTLQILRRLQPATRSTSTPSPLSPSTFLSAAGEIAGELRRHALLAPDGSVTWDLVRQDEGSLRRVPLGPHLGSGVLGVAVFLAGFDRVRGESGHREICLGTVAPLRRDIARLQGRPARLRHAPGGMSGLGSMIYGLLVLGDLLEDPGLTLDAARLCRLLDPAQLREETRLDVMFGLAGLLLSLLALDRTAAGEEPIELAALCAQRLAEAWMAAGDSPGFSHGAAGISCALTRFARRTGDPLAREAAEAALAAAERGFAGPSQSWCNGAAGLHIACIEARRAAPLERLEDAPGLYDHLCCGHAGRADVLAHAARSLRDPELLAAARRLGMSVLERHREAALRFPHPEILVEPRLLRGPTGVGYAFLRLAAPDLIPCLLAFEGCDDEAMDSEAFRQLPAGSEPAGASGGVPGPARPPLPSTVTAQVNTTKEVHHGEG